MPSTELCLSRSVAQILSGVAANNLTVKYQINGSLINSTTTCHVVVEAISGPFI